MPPFDTVLAVRSSYAHQALVAPGTRQGEVWFLGSVGFAVERG